jgi:sodium transport system ATP-binding protein
MEPTQEPSVQLREVSRRFGSTLAVDGISLDVSAGEVVGLLGPNGAGKTTTLRMLAGLIKPSSGSVRLCGLDVERDPLEARRKLGFLTASTRLYDRLTPREIMRTFGSLHGFTAETLEARIEILARELDLLAFIDKRCGSLSSGQIQRVSVARATVHDPQVYVLDEPTAALDPVASQSILEMVRQASSRGRAVLFSTHRMDEAEFLCSRLYFLRQGKVAAQGTAQALREASGKNTLTAAFLHYAQAGIA